MKASTLVRCGIALIVIGILLHFEAESWSSIQVDPSLTSSTKPVYMIDANRFKSYVFTSEISGVLGVILTSIAAFRLVKA